MAECKMGKKLVAYAHGVLPPREAAQVAEHLSRCAECASELKLLRVMNHFQAPEVPEGPDLWPALRGKIAERAHRVPWWRTKPALTMGVASIACAVLFAGSMRFHPGPSIVSPPIARQIRIRTAPKPVVEVASLGDFATGFPANYIREQLPSRGRASAIPNPDPQLGGLMVSLGSPLVQKFGPAGKQPPEAPSDDEPTAMGGGDDESPNVRRLVAPSPGPLQEGDELLINGDFEELRNGLPVGWYSSSAEDPQLQFRSDDQASCWGKHSVVVERLPEAGDITADPNNWAQDIFRIPEGRMVNLTAFIRTREVGLLDRRPANFSHAAVAIQCWNKDRTRIIAYASTQNTAGQIQRNTEWTQYSAALRVPEGTGAITVRAMLVGNGRAWFDGISLKVGPDTSLVGTNLLTNGGFEEKEAGRIVPQDWYQAKIADRPGLRLFRDAMMKRSGEASATILNISPQNSGGNNWAQVILNPPVGRKLRFRGYVRGKGNDSHFGVGLGIQCLDSSLNRPLVTRSVTDLNCSDHQSGWKRMETEVEVPQGTYAVVVRAVARGAGRAWFDDMSLMVE